MALTGYDDTPIAEIIGLISVRQPIAQIASSVIELLMADIAQQRASEHRLVVEPRLVVCASTQQARR